MEYDPDQYICTATVYDDAGNDQNICTSTVYNPYGNAVATIDPLGVITRQYYDKLNRVTNTMQNLTDHPISNGTPPRGTNVINIYASDGYDAAGNIAWLYDALSRPLSITDPFTGTMAWSGCGLMVYNSMK